MFIFSEQENRVVNFSLVVSYYWDDEKENIQAEATNGDIFLFSPEEIQEAGLPLPR